VVKEWFSRERMTALSALASGSGSIHVIGVSGVAMAQMAVALSSRGFSVTGSDKEFYEPMGSFLRRSSVALKHGYAAENVPERCDLVLIGNAVSYGHPEVEVVERLGLPYTIFPKLLFDMCIEGRHSIVVSGTHGKTTTTAMIATALRHMNADPSYFVGGAIPGLDSGLQAGSGKFSVVEGDEYDSSFFAKVPKFSFYKPDSLIINAIEFDHADIYPNLAAIDREFEGLVTGMNAPGVIYCCVDGAHERELVQSWRAKGSAKFVTFGTSSGVDLQIDSVPLADPDFSQRVTATWSGFSGGKLHFRLQSPGQHNAKNAGVAAAVLSAQGFSVEQIRGGLEAFPGVKRRQEIRYSSERVVLIDDFAHHPTAVRETLAAIRQRYPSRRLLAVFEPRSNTSRRKVFQADYIDAFGAADEVFLALPKARGANDVELLDVGELAQNIATRHKISSLAFEGAESIRAAVTARIEVLPHSVVLVMSNGGFDGLVQQLADMLSKS
jgi:UDP-N-acetylmuramate: L-alanyl-gamma-D-glutamyl-meso-diaminopimelate ligase